LFLVYFFVI